MGPTWGKWAKNPVNKYKNDPQFWPKIEKNPKGGGLWIFCKNGRFGPFWEPRQSRVRPELAEPRRQLGCGTDVSAGSVKKSVLATWKANISVHSLKKLSIKVDNSFDPASAPIVKLRKWPSSELSMKPRDSSNLGMLANLGGNNWFKKSNNFWTTLIPKVVLDPPGASFFSTLRFFRRAPKCRSKRQKKARHSLFWGMSKGKCKKITCFRECFCTLVLPVCYFCLFCSHY